MSLHTAHPILAPEAHHSLIQQSAEHGPTTITYQTERMGDMARALGAPHYADDTRVVLAVGKGLGRRSDTPYEEAPDYHVYTEADAIGSGTTPQQMSKEYIERSPQSRVLEVTVTKWSNQELDTRTAKAIVEPELKRRRRRNAINISALILGGMVLPGAYAAAVVESKPEHGTVGGVIAGIAGILAVWQLYRGYRMTSKAYDSASEAAAKYKPFTITSASTTNS